MRPHVRFLIYRVLPVFHQSAVAAGWLIGTVMHGFRNGRSAAGYHNACKERGD